MPLPQMDDADRKKPLCYDPVRQRFIYFDDIVSGRAGIVPVQSLNDKDFKKLAIERQLSGPDYEVAARGRTYTRAHVVEAIKQDSWLGRDTIEAEKSYLESVLAEIQRSLP